MKLRSNRILFALALAGVGISGSLYLPNSGAAQKRAVDKTEAQQKVSDGKQRPSEAFEIKLPAETEGSYLDGNKRVSSKTGYPAAIYDETYKAKSTTPEAKAREYLSYSKMQLGLNDSSIQEMKLHAVREDESGSVVRLRQTWKGLPVNNNAEITVHIAPDGTVDFVMNGFRYGITMEDVKPVITADAAAQKLLTHLRVKSRGIKPATELMVLHHQDTDYLVYRVNIFLEQPSGDWEAYVDAKTGELLKVEDTAYYHRPKGSVRGKKPAKMAQMLVNGTGNVFDPDPLTTATVAYGTAGYTDGSDANTAQLSAQRVSVTLPDITQVAAVYSLTGPYAQIIDNESPFKGLFTQASPTFAFDRADDAFEAVMCYYHIDQSMRYLNTTLGVTVMPTLYVGGVKVDPSGFNGDDNSHYVGSTQHLAFGEGGVDDAEDADVIWHELGHGIHHWITNGSLSQVNGLSEGTGDYWAGSYSRFKGFWPPGAGNIAYNWTFNWDGHNPFWNGRVLNYAPTYPGGLVNQIHTDGQIWATANMKIWDDIGRERADKAFWRGIAMTNSASNQNDAANAVRIAANAMGYTFAERTAIYNRYTAAGYTVQVPTAATVSLSGRVLGPEGRAVRTASVTIRDQFGVSTSVRTDGRGNFMFTNLNAGETYVVTASARRYTFEPQTVTLSDNVSGFNLIAE